MERRLRSAWSLPTTPPLGLAAPGAAPAYPAREVPARTAPVASAARTQSHGRSQQSRAVRGIAAHRVRRPPRTGARATRNASFLKKEMKPETEGS
ncbi:putative Ubiquitin Carboxyl-Terminal Hydrolase Faf-X [Manis pentadactyla]|nr:putative Ubiquitin Carboxyl-Terminal Hydrolase Faf-X [Manis pentadactyla]